MTGYIFRRLLWTIPALWVAATLVWIFMFLIPGDPARVLAGQRADAQVLSLVRAEWGLDQPGPARYARFLGKLIRFDLGTSYAFRQPVAELLLSRLGATFFLALSATLLSVLAGLMLGSLSAARTGTWIDTAATGISTAGIALPTFWVGLMLVLVFASRLRWLPVSGYGDGVVIAGIHFPSAANLVLPSITLAFFSCGFLARVSRASLLEESTQDYARTARSRGVSANGTLLRHVMANAMLPVVTLVGMQFGALLGGAIVTETVFNWPGLGRMIFDAINARDLPLIEGAVLLMTALVLLVNLAVDISYALLDPRVRRG